MNTEDNHADAEKDREALKANQAEIIRLNKALKEDVRQQGLDSEARHRILCEQLASMQAQMKVLTQQGALTRTAQRSVPFHTLTIEATLAEGQLSTVYRGRWHEQFHRRCRPEIPFRRLEGP